ncbi:hypothetical protein NPIL_509741 [Nephila pilipes]|uniref:Endonuclease/exonuclease/phosphatase domain-containing protein n=1 Tax=Nephila pilipes TaxID=299642 RepID=A0A8X6TD21_NEPPI|nr:hypothetical protein NPIL_509741 [Nephila pilipes]
MSLPPRVESFRVFQWNAGGLSQSKRTELLKILHEKEIDVFSIMETNLASENLKCYPFKGDDQLLSQLSDCDKGEVAHLDVWKSGVLFKILDLYSPPCNSPDFSYVNHGKHTIFVGDFNAHSPIHLTFPCDTFTCGTFTSMWYIHFDTNEAGGRVQDFLSSSTFELVYNKEDPHS